MALSVAWGSRLPFRLYQLPGVSWLQDQLYSLVARSRRLLPGIQPYCERFPRECNDARD
jgi:hypothetical protein